LWENHDIQAPPPFPCPRLCLILAILTLSLALTGCASLKSWFGFDDSTTVQQSAESLAVEGMDDFNVGKYHSALKNFEEIMDRFPSVLKPCWPH
jgi:outer membrane protein assembly factor BamD (BamD/ComL family)